MRVLQWSLQGQTWCTSVNGLSCSSSSSSSNHDATTNSVVSVATVCAFPVAVSTGKSFVALCCLSVDLVISIHNGFWGCGSIWLGATLPDLLAPTVAAHQGAMLEETDCLSSFLTKQMNQLVRRCLQGCRGLDSITGDQLIQSLTNF